MKIVFKIFLFFLIVSPVLLLTGCEKGTDFSVNAMVNNQSKESLYIWVGESKKAGQSDLIQPGQFKSINLGLAGREGDGKSYFDDNIRMHVSRDFSGVLKESVVHLNNNYDPSKTMYVRWTGNDFKIDY